MRFLLAFHITLVINDKNKLDVHTPYTDIHLHMNNIYIHTYSHKYPQTQHWQVTGKHFLWCPTYYLHGYVPKACNSTDTHIHITQGEPKRRKETYGIYNYVTCNIFLLLHSSQQAAMQIQVLPTFSLWRHSPRMHRPSSRLPTCVWYSRCKTRMAMTVDSGPPVGGRHGQGSREERQWPSTSLSPAGGILWWVTDL